jgi:hypothetical protein
VTDFVAIAANMHTGANGDTALMQFLAMMRNYATTGRLVDQSKLPGPCYLLLQSLVRTGCAEH